MAAESVKELKGRIADRMTRKINLPSCMCGAKRQPRRILEDGISYLVCDGCGGRTTELKS